MFAGRPPFAFLRWFQLFCFFHVVLAVCLPDYGSPFSFATNICGLVFLSLPQAGICGLFFLFLSGICVQFLSYTAFSDVGIRARLSVFPFFLS